MKFKEFLKQKLGNKYQKFYLKNILSNIFGKFFFITRDNIRKIKKKI